MRKHIITIIGLALAALSVINQAQAQVIPPPPLGTWITMPNQPTQPTTQAGSPINGTIYTFDDPDLYGVQSFQSEAEWLAEEESILWLLNNMVAWYDDEWSTMENLQEQLGNATTQADITYWTDRINTQSIWLERAEDAVEFWNAVHEDWADAYLQWQEAQENEE